MMPILEERQIYKSGKSSLAITLPRGWLSYFKLKAGDKVEIEADGELIIRPKQETDAEAKTTG